MDYGDKIEHLGAGFVKSDAMTGKTMEYRDLWHFLEANQAQYGAKVLCGKGLRKSKIGLIVGRRQKVVFDREMLNFVPVSRCAARPPRAALRIIAAIRAD